MLHRPAAALLVCLLALLLLPGLATAAGKAEADELDVESWPADYDAHFQKYSKHYFGADFDWRWFKAQAIAESRLQPGARSGAGAVGLMQILPSTYAEIRRKNPQFQDIQSPRWNIAAAIYYDRGIFDNDTWQALPKEEKLRLTFGGYNAGPAGVQRAWRRASQPVQSWNDVAHLLPGETRHYVRRIHLLKTGTALYDKRPSISARGFAGRAARRWNRLGGSRQ